jgi:hypothetical protein
MKRCFKCKKAKPLDQFYVHSETLDGHLGKCKACTKKDVRRRYYDPRFRPNIIAYEKARFRQPDRKAKALEYAKQARKRHPGKARARTKVARAVRAGKIKRLPCQTCGSLKVEAHHTDYRKPLSVVWLCRKHHMEAENKSPF